MMNSKINFAQELEQIRSLDDEIYKIFKNVVPRIHLLIESSKIPKTVELFRMFISSTSFLKKAIFDSLENDNLYSSKVLFRSLIEHYLRFMFLFFNYLSNKNDSESEYYTIMIEISEHLNYNKPISSISKVNSINTQNLDTKWKELCLKFPELSKYSKKEIGSYSKRLSIKNIIKFINKQVGISDDGKYVLLPNMILEYSKLSSYVHGGISAFKECYIYSDKTKREIEQRRLGQLTFHIAAHIKSLSYLIFSKYDNDLEQICLETDRLIKKINKLGIVLKK